ncbi:MAG TPA: ParA family protein [Anaerolineales bacterium]|nr:ParA family protein [Anaerolineales bacterium]
MAIITIANQKGGVGKTTTAVHLGHGLALKGHHVLIVDLDPQGHVATALGMNPEGGTFYLLVTPPSPLVKQWVRMSGRDGLDIVPGDATTNTAQVVLNAENRPLDAVARVLSIFSEYDYIILDTAPSVGGIQERAIWAADGLIIPTATDFLAVDGVAKVMEILPRLQEHGWRGEVLGILPTFYDSQTRESRANLAALRENFPDLTFSPIHRATVLRECAAEGLTVYEHAPRSRAAQEYQALVDFVLRWR